MGGQETLSNLLSAVNANIANELPFQCPKCVGTGRINSQANECDYWVSDGQVSVSTLSGAGRASRVRSKLSGRSIR